MGGGKDQNVNDETIMRRDIEVTPEVSRETSREVSREVSNVPPVAANDVTPTGRSVGNAEPGGAGVPLFSDEECQSLRSRWESLQVGFVDEPRQSVERADQLVNEAINGLAHGFSSQRERLEQQWHRDQAVSTEDLRLAFRRYRSFFERLVSM
jgi:hypothetical protein